MVPGMKYAVLALLVLACVSLIAALRAACFWYRSSKVSNAPAWPTEIRGDELKNAMAWVAGLMVAYRKVSDLNGTAAVWTAVAAILGALATFVSVLITLAMLP